MSPEEFRSDLLRAAAKLPEAVRPIADYIEKVEPDIVLGCDCDARPISVALRGVLAARGYDVRYEDRWITSRLGMRMDQHLKTEFDYLREIEQPRVAVVDDYISSRAHTLATFRGSLRRNNLAHASVDWLTLAGRGAALSVYPNARPNLTSPWRDQPGIIGISYTPDLQPVTHDTQLGREFYTAIRENLPSDI